MSIKEGQKVWTLNVGNAARRVKSELTERVVSKVGRKYFYIEVGYRSVKFYIDTLIECSDYTSDYAVYLDPQEYYDEVIKRELLSKIKPMIFPQYGKSSVKIEHVKKIAEILGVE